MTAQKAARGDDDAARRREIAALLDSGLETEAFPRADSHEQVQAILARLRAIDPGDLARKIAVAGLTDHTITHEDLEQPCETCMYYLVHRRYCELPELNIPVEPQWSCRLWRI
jgi:hypothetical protein